MKAIILYLFFFPFLNGILFAGPGQVDSANHVVSRRAYNLRLNTRIHSMGLFSYGGRLVSGNPVLDFNVNYDRKTWGFQIFKALDLHDSGTPINFTLAVLNKNLKVGKKLTITPSVGFILEQFKTIADHGSDVVLIVVTGFKVSRGITLEHSTLFGNLLLEPEMKDWVNRLRLIYSKNHLDLTLMGWHNNSIFDSADYTTAGLSVFYSRMKLGKTGTLHAGMTGLFMPYSSNESEIPKKNGVFLTLSLVLD